MPTPKRQKFEILNLKLGKDMRREKRLRDVPNFVMEKLSAGIIGRRSHMSFN